MAVLPIELIEHVLGFVGDSNDTKTLNSCALASRQLLPAIRLYKYSSISITTDDDPAPLQNFARLLQDSPIVAEYVGSFSFFNRNRARHARLSTYKGPWVTVDSGRMDLPAVLKGLSKLKSIRLCASPNASYPELSKALKLALISTFRLPTLCTVDLVGFREIPAVIFESSSIKELRITLCTFDVSSLSVTQVSYDTHTSQPTDPQAQTANLQVVEFGDASPPLHFFLHPHCPLNHTSLRHLSVQIENESGNQYINRILDNCKASLESLNILLPGMLRTSLSTNIAVTISHQLLAYSPGLLQSLALAGLQKLKHISIRTHIGLLSVFLNLPVEDKLFPAPIIPITSLLSTLPGLSHSSSLISSSSSTLYEPPCTVESISLGFINYFVSAKIPPIKETTKPGVLHEINIRIQAWERLDDILTSVAISGRNKGHTPSVAIHCLEMIDVKSLTERCLKRCHETGRMKVVVEKM
ncbi:hypothetical protein AX16_010723 [Volvariella volvacea WC 439]|nr:hypothetical protein AX16_010723 [Volvariella volvacea WC 439]